jgi:hypothetical protein
LVVVKHVGLHLVLLGQLIDVPLSLLPGVRFCSSFRLFLLLHQGLKSFLVDIGGIAKAAGDLLDLAPVVISLDLVLFLIF